ncbi:COX15/CtaA family protein [Deinococcus peraridilitoris]|uniref:Uncharacterized protein required for cytochrome oxidase assembly n=1 Tax=Deinococcus peraridilitoris (strain DSM 19664 / LMG 22246 / CIP 109416 / KR-200) TaxID=937777 RepID=K9ZY79_DEIPD|nr:COX15/CtaA family protein [Deinococcus peraridilitoris]AFZ66139.1 uncharacterized protein required for cytochrome oxidase assembly [Deinococcus peraridilitoris DSM 19664]
MKAQLAAPRRALSLSAFAWSVLAYNIVVILWGAYVRISGSGAGCGSHWPLCNGEVVPQSPSVHTLIEVSHRVSSSLSGLLAIVLVVWAFRRPKGDPVRLGAAASLTLIILEGFVGGVQVLLGLTADSRDPARGFVQGVHFANTFALTGALLLTALWASGAPRPRLRGQGWLGWGVAFALVSMILLGMAGAVTALGDLLFRPEGTVVVDTLRRDFGAAATILERLRVVHPVMAIAVSAYLLVFSRFGQIARPSAGARLWGSVLTGTIALQMLAGFLNVALKAPGWMQLTHLLLACMMWLVTVLLCFFLLTAPKAHRRFPEVHA